MIVVSSGCQSGAITAALAGMLPDDHVAVTAPFGPDASLHDALAQTQTWVTSFSPDQIRQQLAPLKIPPRVIAVPNLYFRGFHPDIFHTPHPAGGMLGSAAGEYSSALVLYGWRQGLDADQIRRCFRAEVYQALGYYSVWSSALQVVRERFDDSDLAFADWYLPLVRGGAFMLTDNHPTVAALVQLARQVAKLLNADPALVEMPWDTVIPDGLLATSTVWPVYPELAAVLGVRGGYVWRCRDGQLLGLEPFIEQTLRQYRDVDPQAVGGPHFIDDPQIAELCAVHKRAGVA
ncbi:MAG TPA: WcbI family polysaccharide biosynthesis putative acetyltransferase [Ilumatobacteraceae bacterium]|nr:WcbI family polysaccharide biosynthesis putative acetyltransferase [Ilumatobacteraceae bacterium]